MITATTLPTLPLEKGLYLGLYKVTKPKFWFCKIIKELNAGKFESSKTSQIIFVKANINTRPSSLKIMKTKHDYTRWLQFH